MGASRSHQHDSPRIPARDFYGPEGVYGGFAGHDVTKAFALNSLEEKDLDVAE